MEIVPINPKDTVRIKELMDAVERKINDAYGIPSDILKRQDTETASAKIAKGKCTHSFYWIDMLSFHCRLCGLTVDVKIR